MARLNFLRRNDSWGKLFERMLDERDRDLVWRAAKGGTVAASPDPAVWPSFPLEDPSTGESRWADVTFRLGLIARLSGRPLEIT